jgi:hypothetical protein
MKRTIEKESSESKKNVLKSKIKTNKKLDNLQIIESEKQEEVNKLIFKLSI